MRIVVDLDGVICSLKNPDELYSDVKPNMDLLQLMREWKEYGHVIIIYTARHMRTCDGNVNEVINRIGKTTEDWLRKWNVPYDELCYGKPYADIYIDDLAITFHSAVAVKSKIESMKANVVIPMAGEGKRFKDVGFEHPKYMIQVKGKTLFEWSLDSLPLDLAKRIIFVCLDEHEKRYHLSNFIREVFERRFPKLNYKIVFIPKITRGQVETAFYCKDYINNDEPLVIYNIDTHFRSTRLNSRLLTVQNQNIDGILGAHKSKDPKLSFIELDENGFVKRTKEKQPISDLASTGLYIFTKGKDFVNAAEVMIKNDIKTKNEFFVSEIYNILIKKNKRFTVDIADEFIPLGTPDDVHNFSKF